MSQWKKRALALVCVLALAAGTAAAAGTVVTKRLEAQYMGIRLMVSGKEVTPTDANGKPVEPFAVDGTVYLPVRAVGEALGKDVTWDAETRTVRVGLAPLEEDAELLVSTVEAAHPAFALDAVPEGYGAAKAALLETAAAPDCTVHDFAWAALAYTSSLDDAHTYLNVFGSGYQPALDIGWLASGNKLYLTDSAGAPTAREVTAIGGVSVAQVFAAVDHYFMEENETCRDTLRTLWSKDVNLLLRAGARLPENHGAATVTLSGGETRSVPFVQKELPAEIPPFASLERLGDVVYVDLDQCLADDAVSAALKELTQAVQAGGRKVILDVRGNPGGDSSVCQRFLKALGMEPPQYGGLVRYSALAQEERGYDRDSGVLRQNPDLSAARPNPDIELAVLTDELTASSALMLAVWVQDGGLGTVIGRPCANSPSHYGDILSFQLPHSGVSGTVSHKQFLRPDREANQETLVPEVETAVGEDALQAALDWMKTH